MIKVLSALPRRSDLTREQFQEHWGTIHRDLALRIDRISRYVQSHPRSADLPGLTPAPFDGFPEVWFPDLDTALGLGADPQYAQGAHLDEPRFIDRDAMVRTLVTPHLVRGWDGFATRTGAGKILLLADAPATDEARDVLATVALEALDPRRLLVGAAVDDARVRHLQGHGQVLELWWDDADAAVAAWAAGVESLLARADDVLDPAGSCVALVQERRVRWPGTVEDPDA